MKTKVAILVILYVTINSSFFIPDSFSQWVQMSDGMGINKEIHSFVLKDNIIFAGSSSNGVYLSTNDGQNWVQTSLNNNTVYSISTSENNIFAGTNTGVYLSTNNGLSWTQRGLNNEGVYSLAINGNNIFAGTSNGSSPNGIYRSTNNGQNWTQTALNNKSIWALTVSDNQIFAGTSNGVFLSTNNGQNWTQTALNDKLIETFAITENKIFAGTYLYGVFVTSNSGQSWTNSALNNKTVRSISISGNNIFAGTYTSGVYLSTNDGQNWIQKNQGFYPYPGVLALLIENNYIFAGTVGNSVWRRSFAEIISCFQNISTEIPSAFSLEQNYPNPFNPNTNIKFQIAKPCNVKLIVFDILGKEVATLVNETLQPGIYETTFDASNLTSGIYFYRLQTDNFVETKKLILLK